MNLRTQYNALVWKHGSRKPSELAGITWLGRGTGRGLPQGIVGVDDVVAVVSTAYRGVVPGLEQLELRRYVRGYGVTLDDDKRAIFGGETNCRFAYDMRRLLRGAEVSRAFTSPERTPEILAAMLDIEYVRVHAERRRRRLPQAPYLPTVLLGLAERFEYRDTPALRKLFRADGLFSQGDAQEGMLRMAWDRQWVSPDNPDNPTGLWLVPHYLCGADAQEVGVFLDFRQLLGMPITNPAAQVPRAMRRPFVLPENPAPEVLGGLSYPAAIAAAVARSVPRQAAVQGLIQEWRNRVTESERFTDTDIKSAMLKQREPALGFASVYAELRSRLPGDYNQHVTDDDLAMALVDSGSPLCLASLVSPSLWWLAPMVGLEEAHRFSYPTADVDLWSPPARLRAEFSLTRQSGSRPAQPQRRNRGSHHVRVED